ncbi:MAG TPA: class III extradiol ring-cleavage dioxygenase [Noviherbaspirillum sp.]|jgi:aromatic ring-opening dioxygenase catalytic subunit (LigB family)|uniref:DODA-type extradiol aromatic ring-opening family dioxygenase n=1 Tax=Noviherbaspirillum sp. TaxID=1926288 RepID=UPI002F927708
MKRLPTYFVSHGGGPWPWMKEQSGGMFDKLEASLQEMARTLPEKPKAILVVSGHWEENAFTISAGAAPGMIYDYTGFPEHTYHVKYPAPGSPELAQRIQAMLKQGGVEAKLDPQRGYDHGTFTVMAPAFPDADIPVVQLSLRRDLDPKAHIEVGKLLAPLRDEGVLIIGSGLSYHNLRMFTPAATAPSQAFDRWLQTALTQVSPQEREQYLLQWDSAPAARIAHPHEDHFLPLMVVVGAAGTDAGERVYHEDFMGIIAVSSFRFESAEHNQ